MKRLIALLLALMLLLCGCNADWEDEAAPSEKVEQEISAEGGKQEEQVKKEEEKKKQAPPSASKEGQSTDTKAEQKDEGGKSDAKTLGALHDTGWAAGATYLYGETAYYHLEREGEAYIYSLKLGKGNQPIYMGEGSLFGQYRSLLFKVQRGTLYSLDLADSKSSWKKLGVALQEGQCLLAGERLLVWQGKNMQTIHLKEQKMEAATLDFEIKKAVYEKGSLYYSVEKAGKVLFYKSGYDLKIPTLLHTAEKGFEWEMAGDRVLFHQSQGGSNPYVFDLKSLKAEKFKEFELGVIYPNVLSEPLLVRFWEGVAYIEMVGGKIYAYDLQKEQGKELEEIPDADLQKLRNGGVYRGGGSGAEHTFMVSLNGKEYCAYQNGYTGLYLRDANEYGAILTHAARIFICRWSEGDSFENFKINEHPLL